MGGYFSEVLMSLNFVLSAVPRPFTTEMIASEIPAAIKPYSMAVAPVSSLKNDLMTDIGSDLGLCSWNRSSPCSSYPGPYGNESKATLTSVLQLFRVLQRKIYSNLNEFSCGVPSFA